MICADYLLQLQETFHGTNTTQRCQTAVGWVQVRKHLPRFQVCDSWNRLLKAAQPLDLFECPTEPGAVLLLPPFFFRPSALRSFFLSPLFFC